MLFNSLPFLFGFLPVCLAGYHVAAKLGHDARLHWLALSSLFFYAVWNARFLALLLGSVLLNFGLSQWIARAKPEKRSHVLALSVTLNLALLFYYKYLFSLLASLASSAVGAKIGLAYPHPILLPLGISFFTFTQISYLVDLAQGQAEAQDFLSYLLFVTFFPHLIAGPLLHHREIMPQFEAGERNAAARKRGLRSEDLTLGFTWFVLGLAKKVLIADKLAPAADLTFAQHGMLGMLPAWSGLLIYCMQLYFDFSGYSDMAIGLARMFGIRFPMNFNSPWKATSVADYWQRWHITLTRYVTLYLYNPILLHVQRKRLAQGKKTSRKSLATLEGFTSMVAFPTVITMVLTGIWHGAGLQFLIFGLLHGLYLIANQAYRHLRDTSASAVPAAPVSKAKLTAMRLGMLLQVAVALAFFRSDSLLAALNMLRAMLGARGPGGLESAGSLLVSLAILPVVWFLPNTQQLLGEAPFSKGDPAFLQGLVAWRPTFLWAFLTACLFFACLANLDEASSFLYFQF